MPLVFFFSDGFKPLVKKLLLINDIIFYDSSR